MRTMHLSVVRTSVTRLTPSYTHASRVTGVSVFCGIFKIGAG